MLEHCSRLAKQCFSIDREHPPGDILVTGVDPHDYSILRKEWPDTYGRITPQLPEDRSVNQRVLIMDLPVSIDDKEIKDTLFADDLHPKLIQRFNRKDSQEKSTTVLVSFSSKEQKDKLLANGYRAFYQKFKVVEYREDPQVTQCFRCQAFGHHYHECQAEKQKCLRCAGDHRHRVCPKDRNDVCCANCGKNHVSTYRGCPVFKDAVKAEREKRPITAPAAPEGMQQHHNHQNQMQQHQQSQQQCQHLPQQPQQQPQNDQQPHQQLPQPQLLQQQFLHHVQQQQQQENFSFLNPKSMEEMVTAFSLCIQMIMDAVKEMMSSGQAPQEIDCRSIAQTCVESFSFMGGQSRQPSVWESAARRRRATGEASSAAQDSGQAASVNG